MPRIRILPDRVANQIAAGEVIERPAAVVKELLENALDARATRITVEFAHSGRALIRVEDNGQGMAPEDARLALRRHATSKIAEAADLDALATFGFRGEALPSIASVSRFTLQSREAAQEAGVEIIVHAGRVVNDRECGRPVGTRIDVEHLFEPVPARRKFLKSDRTESGHIVSCVRLYALACPAAAFALWEDGREIFRSPECARLEDRVAEIYGPQAATGLLPIDFAADGLRLTGLIGGAGVARGSRQDLVAFVNGRPVESRTVHGALLEAYREYLPEGRYPVAFLFLTCPPADVDVNVHPAKREVRFRREAVVRGFLIRAVLERLRETQPPVRSDSSDPFVIRPDDPVALPAPFHPWVSEPVPADAPAPALAPAPLPPAPRAILAPAWKFLGTAHSNYTLFETPGGLVLLDRRAAHERVWYERLRAQFLGRAVPVQQLLLALPLEFSPVAAAVLTEHLAFLSGHGFEIEEFGRHCFRVDALPAWMEPGDAEPFLRDLVDALREGRLPPGNLDLARDELARLAAAKAVRLPALTGEREALGLLRELFLTSAPVTSPGGRPTFVELNHGELSRRFQK